MTVAADADFAADPEAGLDYLVDAGVLDEDEHGLRFTHEFEDTWLVYADSYMEESDETVTTTVAQLFDLDETTAAEYVDELGVTREDLVALLSLRAHLDAEHSTAELATLAGIVVEVGPPPVVPPQLEALDDDAVVAAVGERGDVVVTVWRRQCEPCRALKAHLDTLLDAFPDDVPVVGVDGEDVPAFRRRHEFDAAPAVLLFADGELVETIEGGIRMDELRAAVDRAY